MADADDERKERDLKLRKLEAEIENLRALTNKTMREYWFYPLVVSAALIGAIGVLVKFIS